MGSSGIDNASGRNDRVKIKSVNIQFMQKKETFPGRIYGSTIGKHSEICQNARYTSSRFEPIKKDYLQKIQAYLAQSITAKEIDQQK